MATHGLIPVRLSWIPYEQRMRAARIAARECVDDSEINDVIFAAMFPSDDVHWVRAQAAALADLELKDAA